MKFALMMSTKPAEAAQLNHADVQDIEAKHADLLNELGLTGEIINGAGLNPPSETTTVGTSGTTSGPLINGEEHVTAYYVVEVANRQRAEAIAARILDDHVTAVEVRAIHNTNGV
jgi:hypothetical protein